MYLNYNLGIRPNVHFSLQEVSPLGHEFNPYVNYSFSFSFFSFLGQREQHLNIFFYMLKFPKLRVRLKMTLSLSP